MHTSTCPQTCFFTYIHMTSTFAHALFLHPPSSPDLALHSQAEISEQEAIKLLNKAAPAALLSYQTSAIDSAVAAYFDAQV